MEIELKDRKFWILENKENPIPKTYLFDDEKSSIGKIKILLKTIPTEKIVLYIVDTSQKEWKLTQVPWSAIVSKLIQD